MRRFQFSDPSCRVHYGTDHIRHVMFAADSLFGRRGGKAVDLHHRYHSATAVSSNLAGFAEVVEAGIAGGNEPVSISDGDKLAVNMDLQKASVFPTTGRVATEADIGKDFDIYVDANGNQFCNMGASVTGVLRVADLIEDAGNYVACVIPPDLRYGNL